MTTLRDHLADWTDWDIAAYRLGIVLGLWPDGGMTGYHVVRATLHGNNLIDNVLGAYLIKLDKAGILESEGNEGEWCRWRREG